MKNDSIKKYLIPNIPYLFVLWAFLKLGTAYRLAAGADFAHKLMGLGQTIGPAFADFAPGLAPFDWLVGIVGAVAFRVMVYVKSKNAKKFRRDEEYGSARWGCPKDIAPFVDPKFENNIILTGTEFLTMNTRPKNPANARNLNACVIGSSGSGNIWGFPYKMGRCGGFTFLIVYLALAAFVGFAIMLSELAIGRSTGFGPVNAYKKVSKKFKWIGWLAIIAPFLIMTFYSVLGGYCIYYMVINVVGMFSGMPDSSSFGALLTNPWASIGCMVLFMVICYLINRGGVGGGIEKFNTIGMPALFVMLVIVIIRAWTLPNADVGLKYMFVPGYALKAGFFDKAPGFMEVLATAGGQMFFSLSLAMGAMITYGSYLGKNENLPKNSVIIVISDTLVAIMAGLAVIPAAVANGIAKGMAVSEIKLGGPNLLFATLQDVFHDMGTIGGIFGLIFYALVLIAAISSAISLIEAVSVTFIDHASAKGHERDRNKVLAVVCLAITLLACLVAVDGLGSNGIAPKDLFHINSKADWCADWLDFMDMISEGIAMPLGAMLMSIMVGWEIKPKSLYGEIDSGYNGHIHGFYTFCIKYLCPVIMFFILLVQISTFFGLGWFN